MTYSKVEKNSQSCSVSYRGIVAGNKIFEDGHFETHDRPETLNRFMEYFLQRQLKVSTEDKGYEVLDFSWKQEVSDNFPSFEIRLPQLWDTTSPDTIGDFRELSVM